MPISDLLIPEFDNEMTVTRNVLARVPDGRGEWKPHPKAFPWATSRSSSRGYQDGRR